MEKALQHQTAIILLEGKTKSHLIMKEWLTKKSLVTNETADLLEVIEDMSDFTTSTRPNVILLKVKSLKKEFPKLQKMMSFFGANVNFPIFAVSEKEKVINDDGCFEGNLVEIKAQLENLLSNFSSKLRFPLNSRI